MQSWSEPAEPKSHPDQGIDGIDVKRGLMFSTRPNLSLRLDLYLPRFVASPRLVVYLHGGAWLVGSRKDHTTRLENLARNGVAVASIDYRTTNHVAYPGQVEDINSAISWLRAQGHVHGYASGGVALMGASAGAHLAAMAGLTSTKGVTALVGLFGVYDLTSEGDSPGPVRGREVPEEIVRARFPKGYEATSARGSRALLAGVNDDDLNDDVLRPLSPIWHVHSSGPRTLLLHGTGDAVVHHSQTVRFGEAARAAGMDVATRLVTGANHEDAQFDSNELLSGVARFITEG